MEVDMWTALIFLIVIALVILTSFIVSLAAGRRLGSRFERCLPFPADPQNDFSRWYGRSPCWTCLGVPVRIAGPIPMEAARWAI